MEIDSPPGGNERVHPGPSSRDDRSLLYIDMAYGLDELRQRKHFQFFEARHSGNYFRKVVGLHPLADRVTELDHPVVRRTFSPRQDVIEASAFGLRLPKFLRPIDFVVSQRRLLRRVIGIVRDENINFVAATDTLYSGLFGHWVARATNRPLIIHLLAHYEDLHRSTGSVAMPKLIPFHWLEKRIISYVSKRADLIAAGSLALGEYANRMGGRAERICHFRVTKLVSPQHRRPPAQRASPRAILAQFDIPQGARLLLTIARLHPVKIVDHAIRAMLRIATAHPDCILLLAGDGPDRQKLEALVQELGLGANVRFLGLLDQDGLASIIPHTIVLSPLTGIALYETSLGGAPTVAYDSDPQVAELVENTTTGFLVPDGDIEAMATGAMRILDDPEQAARMSKAIRVRALQITDPVANEIIEHTAYDQLALRFARENL